jgi:hypothetical protein
MSGTYPEEPTQPPPPSTPNWETYQQPSAPSYPQAPYGQQPYGQQPYGQHPYGQQPYGGAASPYGPVLTPHPEANSAMIMGIVALVGTFVCGVLCVLGPFAWAKGAKARREIDAEPQRWSGRTEATVGYVMGIVTTILMGLAILAVLLIFVVFAATASTV